jgi:hypothetical protein
MKHLSSLKFGSVITALRIAAWALQEAKTDLDKRWPIATVEEVVRLERECRELRDRMVAKIKLDTS